MAFFLHYLLIFALITLNVESINPIAQVCNEFSNTTTPELAKNIDSVLDKLVQNTPKSGFNLTELGEEGTKVMGLGQCRGDVPSQECSTCIQTAAKEIKRICPNQVDARLWYEYCFIRYDTKEFIDQADSGFRVIYYNIEYVTDPKSFQTALMELVDRTKTLVLDPGNKGFGKGETKLSDSMTLYLLFQCTRDLSKYYCDTCVEYAKEHFQAICENKKGCRIIYSFCYARYELYPIFFPHDQKLSLESSSVANYSSVTGKP